MAALANIELISAAGCPYVQRSVALLVQHKIPFTIKSVDLQNKPQWLFEKSPLGKVPSLVRGNDAIFESQVINEFIEDNLPLEKRIQPADPLIRAQNKAWIEFGSSILGDVFTVLSKQTKSEYEAALPALDSKAALFEAHAPFKGPYFNGDKPALVDIAWGGFSTMILMLGSVLSIDLIDKAKYPKLSGWIKATASIPSVQLAALLQLQSISEADTTNPASYANIDASDAIEKVKAHIQPNFAKRFGQSYLWNSKVQARA